MNKSQRSKTGRRAHRAGKRNERMVAKRMNGRVVSGPMYSHAPDIVVGDPPWLVVECKYRKKLSQWLYDALHQAQQFCEDDQLGVAVLTERYNRERLVVMDLDDFMDWFGGNKNDDNSPDDTD